MEDRRDRRTEGGEQKGNEKRTGGDGRRRESQNLNYDPLCLRRSYVDDARNTDNAWVETMAVNFHDDDGTLLRHFQFRAGERISAVAWLDLEFGSDFEPSTSLVLRLTAQKLGAAF